MSKTKSSNLDFEIFKLFMALIFLFQKGHLMYWDSENSKKSLPSKCQYIAY